MERLRNLAREALTWEHLSDQQRLVWAAVLKLDVVPLQETTVWKDGGSLECRVNFLASVVLQELPPWFFERLNITRRARGTGDVNGSMSDPKDVLEESMNAYCDYACTMKLRESRLQLSCSGSSKWLRICSPVPACRRRPAELGWPTCRPLLGCRRLPGGEALPARGQVDLQGGVRACKGSFLGGSWTLDKFLDHWSRLIWQAISTISLEVQSCRVKAPDCTLVTRSSRLSKQCRTWLERRLADHLPIRKRATRRRCGRRLFISSIIEPCSLL